MTYCINCKKPTNDIVEKNPDGKTLVFCDVICTECRVFKHRYVETKEKDGK